MTLKELKIKTNVVKRIYKEHIGYGKEAECQQQRIDKLVAEGADEADVRKQQEVLKETNQMIPDVKKRLVAAYVDLQDKANDPQYQGSEELQEAQTVLGDIDIDSFENRS
ncbi:tubulin binding cofactor A [Halteromyces radiatus]|uniref:tubulin binding cofactor A n=1 Tax=Halteromyces radiatus TaxID=101107 RepID=UPI00221FE61B|nr:tubulin binding cofactor A [Halteromyces radiatus]KAI8092963.1 tubulin binding cofactor A [Halteromyces radiatus]